MNRKKPVSVKPSEDDEEAIAAFIRSRGVTRCPTACAVPTQASVPPGDRAALERYGEARERSRQERSMTGVRSLRSVAPAGGI